MYGGMPREQDEGGPPLPKREAARLRALRSYAILDTAPEEDFEDLVTLAREIYDVPIAFVGFVDEERDWLKASRGVEADAIPREASFCTWSITTPDEPLVVEDATRDPRFQDTPIVRKEGVRFYAGMPIVDDDGHALGTVCILDQEPRTFEPGEEEPLKAMARNAMRLLKLRRTSQELYRRKDEVERYAGAAGERLKDPLSTVTVHHDFLAEALEDASEETRDDLRQAQAGAREIQRIAEQLMEYANLDPEAAAEADPLDFSALLEDVWDGLEEDGETAEAELEVADLPRVRADRRQVRHLLGNVLDNAVRYREDEPVRITVTGGRLGSMCQFEVADDGRGIEPDDLDRVVEVFYRSARSQAVDGSGLGLALCEKVVDLHGGTLRIDSEVGEGTTVSFTLPSAGA